VREILHNINQALGTGADRLQAVWWLVLRAIKILGIVRQSVIAVQSLGNYLRAPNPDKRDAAAATITTVLREHFVLPGYIERVLDQLVSELIEWGVKVAHARFGVLWHTERSDALQLHTAQQAVELVKQQRAPDPILPADQYYLEIAVAEFAEIERRNAARRQALREGLTQEPL
jgi:hypothetical protein